jgi:MFS family permease
MERQSNAVDHSDSSESTGIDRLSLGSVVLALGLGTGLSLLGDSTLYTVLPEPGIAAQVGLTAGLVGVALGLNRLVRIGFNGLAGKLLDTHPRRAIMLVAMGFGVLANLSYALAHSPWLFLAGRVLWGAAWSGIWVGTHAIILDIAPPRHRGRLNGSYQAWFFGGAAATALLGGFLVDNLGFRTTLWLSVGSVAAAWLVWWRLLPETLPAKSHRSARQTSERLSPATWRASLAAAVPYFAARLTLPGVLASTTILWMGNLLRSPSAASWQDLLPLATMTGGFAAVRTLISVVGAPAAGRLSDWMGSRWSVIGASMAAGALGLWLMGDSRLAWALSGALLVALCGGTTHALAPSLVGDNVSDRLRSRSLGVVFTAGDLGSALGPPLALGALAWIPLRSVYLTCAGLLLGVVLFATWKALQDRGKNLNR